MQRLNCIKFGFGSHALRLDFSESLTAWRYTMEFTVAYIKLLFDFLKLFSKFLMIKPLDLDVIFSYIICHVNSLILFYFSSLLKLY